MENNFQYRRHEKNVNDVIEKAGGLLDYAIKERAYIIRKINGIEDQIISFNFSNVQNIVPKSVTCFFFSYE